MSKKNKDKKNIEDASKVEEVNEENVDIVSKEETMEEENMYDSECEAMLGKIEVTDDLNEQAARLENLKKMSEVARIMSEKRLANKKAQLEEKRLEMEEKAHTEELKLRHQEVNAVKRNGVINNIVSIFGTIISFICYGALMARQNEFEARGETITSASGKDISRHAFDFGRMFKRN